MYRLFKLIGALGTAALMAAACGGSGQSTSAKPNAPADASGAQKVDPATAGSISGKVVIDGPVPENTVIKMLSDPACSSAHENGAASSGTYVVENGGLDNVFVYIKDGLGHKYAFATPTNALKIEQKGCQYQPHVLGIRVGQPLEIVNDDSTMHNVHALPDTNQEFNFGQPVPGMKNTVTFTAPEVMIPIKCDVHSWMHAYVGVVDNPYFAVTADGGTFDLRDVPPGTYTIEAWHEKLGHQTQTVTLGDKDNKQITFTFKATEAGA